MTTHEPAPVIERPRLSVVVPCYNEAENLPALAQELGAVLTTLGSRWEVLFVDDGSRDGTWPAITGLHQADRRVQGIRFSRNFGHQMALVAGLEHAAGDAVITMDADLQHPPAVIPRLVTAWESGYAIVHTRRRDSLDTTRRKRFASRLFYRLFSLMAGVHVDEGMADFRLLDRRVVQSLLLFREEQLFLRGAVQWIGFDSTVVPFEARSRHRGSSKFTLRKMTALAVQGITSFSIVPLRLSVILGLITSFAAFVELVYVVAVRLFTDAAVPGWASLAGVVSFLFGVHFILMGVLGEYLGRILVEVRGRPRYIVSDTAGLVAGGGRVAGSPRA